MVITLTLTITICYAILLRTAKDQGLHHKPQYQTLLPCGETQKS